jgi:hypothetical protein
MKKNRKVSRRPRRKKDPAAAPAMPIRIRVSARVLPSTVARLQRLSKKRQRKMGSLIADILDQSAA